MAQLYSVNVALDELNERIADATSEISELETLLDSNDIPMSYKNDFLFVRLAKKKHALEVLEAKRDEIMSLGDNVSYRGKKTGVNEEGVGISRTDERINKLNADLVKAQKALDVASANSKSLYGKRMKKRAEATIKRLSKKEGRLSKRQRRVTSARLKRELRKMAFETRTTVKQNSAESIMQKHETIASDMHQKSEEAYESGHKIQGAYYAMRGKVSERKAGICEQYLARLAKKKGTVKGFNKVSDRFRYWLASKIMPKGYAPSM